MAVSSTPTPKPAGSSMRLYVLLGVLAIISAITIYDYSVASPATVKANQELETFAVKKIGEGVTREGDKVEVDQFVRSADVQKVLGRAPSVTKTFDNPQGGHVVEYYCYRPWLPVPEISKHYVAVVYWGKDNPRYMSHHINCVPPPDAYPDYRGDGPHGAPPEGGPEAAAAGGAGLAPAVTGGGGAPGEPAPPAPFSNRAANELTSPPPGMPGAAKGGKDGKGEKGGKQRPDSEEAKSDEKPAAEKPAEAAPAEEKPTEEKPAEKPAEEKPAEAAPAEEKPAEPAAEGTEPKPEESK